mmetsp:Transcript_31924/g.42149  ORF Transcript_31924/g.42149 Transcript_31924/m.42149 type:complete len:269 (-) Transcript_31924:334-1140(-)|eukprot:CAMPEP_0117756054 /NCGR_PEP_ID=MMETSP0947-20121206/13825_1 /TAXON_ID=44440 /ORGANISM="Chattonella subsalsa, Strain CCMP2191" /LENGTH=268 /DNA_ID=CAMNT_0005575519 /DNA_START=90 /DNA_END=896 /DNA_ORIENTATION=-
MKITFSLLVVMCLTSWVNRCVDAFQSYAFGSHQSRSFQSSRLSARAGIRAEDVLKSPKWPAKWPFTDADFRRADESSDGLFYEDARLVYHIDDPAVSALTKFYSENFPAKADVLDICSSWVSHFPETWDHGNRVGLGMNEYELSKNAQLDEYNVKDLNVDPSFPYEDNSFDIVTCVVSIDYLNKPLKVMREVNRVLRPGGKAIMSMSNRCFPTKVINIWLQTNDLEHLFIVGSYFHYSGGFEAPEAIDISPNPGRSDPMYIVQAKKLS